MLRLASVHRYLVKSCRGEDLTHALVERQGLAGDRRWMLVDEAGDVITARRYPQLLTVIPRLAPDGGLDLTAPQVDSLHVTVPEGPGAPLRVHGKPVPGVVADQAAHAWFSSITGVASRLVYLADTTKRAPNQLFGGPQDRVSFADAYPVLAATTASLAAVSSAAGTDLDMRRFRPNLVIDGGEAWAEDGWRRLQIGDATFRAVKGSDRCALTLSDPETGVRGREPIRTLARIRRFDGRTWFGMNLIPDTPGASVEVGAPVRILEAVAAPDGPPR